MLRVDPPKRRMEKIFKTFLTNYSFNWAGQAPEHVQDVGWDGPDIFRNLWPLNSAANSRGNKSYYQKVPYQKDHKKSTGTPFALVGKRFRIKAVKS